MCENPPHMASPLSTQDRSGVNQRLRPLNPNAKSFRPEQKALPTIIGLSHPQTLLQLPYPFEAWPVVPRFHDRPNYGYPPAGPYGSYGAVLYNAASQPQPVFGVSYSVGCCGEDSEVEKVMEKLRGLKVSETFGCGIKVDRRSTGRVLRPRFSRRKRTVNCRGKVWMPKKGGFEKSGNKCVPDGRRGSDIGGAGAGAGGVLAIPPTVHENMCSRSANDTLKHIHDQFKRGKSYKKSSGLGCIIPFPATLEEVVSSEKTTVMIKNIPNQFKRDDLLAILDKHCEDENVKRESRSCKSAYDCVYLPMDFIKSWYQGKIANLGYAFVNFTSAIAAFRFFNSFHKHVWEVSENKKICEVTMAELQGKEALINSFKNRLFWCECYSFLPVVLDPPRDGSNNSISTTVGVLVPSLPPRSLRKCS